MERKSSLSRKERNNLRAWVYCGNTIAFALLPHVIIPHLPSAPNADLVLWVGYVGAFVSGAGFLISDNKLEPFAANLDTIQEILDQAKDEIPHPKMSKRERKKIAKEYLKSRHDL